MVAVAASFLTLAVVARGLAAELSFGYALTMFVLTAWNLRINRR